MKDWALAVFTPIEFVFLENGRREMEVKGKITHGLFALCLSSDIKQFNEKIPSCQQLLVSTTVKENNVI